MSFGVSWHTLLDHLAELPDDATLLSPLSNDRIQIEDIQEQRVIVEFLDRDIDPVRPLQREQFETLHRRITDSAGAFDLDRLPPDADPYPAVLSIHPRFEIDEDAGVIREHDGPTTSQLLEIEQTGDENDKDIDRSEPDLEVYADSLLLIDALRAARPRLTNCVGDRSTRQSVYAVFRRPTQYRQSPQRDCRRAAESTASRPTGQWAVRLRPADQSPKQVAERRTDRHRTT